MVRAAVWRILIGVMATAFMGGHLLADDLDPTTLFAALPADAPDQSGVAPGAIAAEPPEEPPPTEPVPTATPGMGGVPRGMEALPPGTVEAGPPAAAMNGVPGESAGGTPLPSVDQVLEEQGQPYTPVISSNLWFAPDRWYLNTDFVVLNHNRSKRNQHFAYDAAANQFFGEQNLSLGITEGSDFTVGLWRCHDTYGWDHAVELSFSGLEDWHKQFEFIGLVPGAIFTFPNFQIGGFNGGDAAFIYYKSQLNSGGIDLRWTKQPGRDELVYDPNGFWKRQAEGGAVFSFLLGIHDTEFDERFTYSVRANNVPPSFFGGDYNNHVTNNLLGLHVGSELDYKHDLWYVGIRGGATACVNFAEVNADLTYADPNRGGGSHYESAVHTGPAAVSELSLLAGWQIRPNLRVHVSYDFLWLTSIGTGPGQVRLGAFQPQAIGVSRDQMFTGMSLGLDFNF